MPTPYTAEFRERALQMVIDRQRLEGITLVEARKIIGERMGVSRSTLEDWARTARRRAARQNAVSQPAAAGSEAGSAETTEVQDLRREITHLKRTNEMLKSAAVFFAAEVERLSTR